MKKQILKPRKTGEQRKRNYRVSIEKRIKRYIKNGGKGDLNLNRTPIKELPDNLKVGGDLSLTGTPIKELPDSLNVGGSLFLVVTPIEKLPDNLQVDSNLFLQRTPLSKKYSKEEIRSMIKEKGGYVKRNIMI